MRCVATHHRMGRNGQSGDELARGRSAHGVGSKSARGPQSPALVRSAAEDFGRDRGPETLFPLGGSGALGAGHGFRRRRSACPVPSAERRGSPWGMRVVRDLPSGKTDCVGTGMGGRDRREAPERAGRVGTSRTLVFTDHAGGGVLPGSAGSMITSGARAITAGASAAGTSMPGTLACRGARTSTTRQHLARPVPDRREDVARAVIRCGARGIAQDERAARERRESVGPRVCEVLCALRCNAT